MTSLRARILFLVAVFGLAIASVLSIVLYNAVRNYYADMQYERSIRFAERLLAMHPDMWERYRARPSSFGDQLRQYTLYEPSVGLYLVGNDGRVLASAGESRLFWSSYQIDLDPVRAGGDASVRNPVFGDDPDAIGAKCIVAARPLVVDGEQRAWLYVVARNADTDTHPLHLLKTYAIAGAVKFALITLTVGALLTMAIIAMFTRPLVALTRVAERIKGTGFAEPFEVPINAIPHCSRNDEIGRLGRAFRDMLDRLRAEMERVTQADTKRREMVASVSHDLRTPLTALTAQLETIRLKADSLKPCEQAHLNERALHNATHLKNLIDALAEVARLDNPEFKAEREPMSLGELADDVVLRFGERADAAGVRLTLDYPDGLPLTPIDAGLIERALSNLIDNALRVTPQGGEVTVVVRPDTAEMRVEVSDTGPGIAPDEQPRVFDAFYQASKHRATRGSSGLGLAIVRRVAELHGGKAGLTSAPGKGSTFFIMLPQSLASPTAQI
ncbi:MAG: HAMP domain-containing sensor histidine kinase [Burkholderiaceae bacterium]